jgi:hypothetical protein
MSEPGRRLADISCERDIANIPGGLTGLAYHREAIAYVQKSVRSEETLHASFHVQEDAVGWSKPITFDGRYLSRDACTRSWLLLFLTYISCPLLHPPFYYAKYTSFTHFTCPCFPTYSTWRRQRRASRKPSNRYLRKRKT